jgi:hypothetical protein
MQNPEELARAGQKFKQELSRVTGDLQTKTEHLKKDEADIPRLQAEIAILKKQIDEKTIQVNKEKAEVPRLKSEIQRDQMLLGAKHRELEALTRSQAEILRQQGVKGVHPLH